MKLKNLTLTLLLVSALLQAAPSAAQGGLRYTIMVSKFENSVSSWKGHFDLGDSWSTIMTAALGENERFIVIGEHDMRREALDEQAFGASGATVQGAKTPQRGNMTPAQLLVKGEITHFESNSSGEDGGFRIKNLKLGGSKQKTVVRATVYIVDSATASVVASKNFEGTSQKRNLKMQFWKNGKSGNYGKAEDESTAAALIDAIDQTIEWMVGRLPSILWRGEIVLVKGNTVVINRGLREGVREGETFTAGESTMLRDPDTGEVLDEDINEQARLKVDRVKEKVAYCKVIDGDASLLYEGMGISRRSGT